MKSTIGQPRGILNLKAGEKKFQLSRHLPAQDLSFFVERYWIVSWDLRGQEPYVQETLPTLASTWSLRKINRESLAWRRESSRASSKTKAEFLALNSSPGLFIPL